jgi:hypothetical protein
MTRKYAKNNFILDDEKYFTLSNSNVNGNNTYYTSNAKEAADHVYYKFKSKYESKILPWIANSKYSVTRPFFMQTSLAINQEVYLEQCIKRRLMPFIAKYHSNDNYVFWPDKASAYYDKRVVAFYDANKLNYVLKMRNLTNVPQCRLIEDFWGTLSSLVYAKGWKAENVQQLKKRIKFCLKKIDFESVKASVSGVVRKLRKVGKEGSLSVVH